MHANGIQLSSRIIRSHVQQKMKGGEMANLTDHRNVR